MFFPLFLSHVFLSFLPRRLSPPFFPKLEGRQSVRASFSPGSPFVIPLVTGASREQGIVGYVMAEQLWWGQGSAALVMACCRGRGCSAAVSTAAGGAADGAWRWENWGKGQGGRR